MEVDNDSVSLDSDHNNMDRHDHVDDDDLDSLVDKIVVDPSQSDLDVQEQHADETRQEIKQVQRITQRETLRIRLWRIVIVMIMIGSGALVSWGTYNYLDDQLMDQTLEDVSRRDTNRRNGKSG